MAIVVVRAWRGVCAVTITNAEVPRAKCAGGYAAFQAEAAGDRAETVDGVNDTDDPQGVLIGMLLALPAPATTDAGVRRRDWSA